MLTCSDAGSAAGTRPLLLVSLLFIVYTAVLGVVLFMPAVSAVSAVFSV